MAITQEPVVTYNGKTLAKSEDHELSCENNTAPAPPPTPSASADLLDR